MEEKAAHQLEKEKALDFAKFMTRVLLEDQTLLVNTLLKSEKEKEYEQRFYNILSYEFLVGDGRVEVNTSFRNGYMRIWQEDFDRITEELSTCTDEKEINRKKGTLEWLQKDKLAMDSAKKSRKRIYQWLLVPDWLATRLIQYGEVVFKYYGCSWWGISSVLKQHFYKEAVLYDIFDELTTNNEHTPVLPITFQKQVDTPDFGKPVKE